MKKQGAVWRIARAIKIDQHVLSQELPVKRDADGVAFAVEESSDAISAAAVGDDLKVATVGIVNLRFYDG